VNLTTNNLSYSTAKSKELIAAYEAEDLTNVKLCGIYGKKKIDTERFFCEYFRFKYRFAFFRLIQSHSSSSADIIGPIASCVPNGLSLTQPTNLK
jgi:hypothetical protein